MNQQKVAPNDCYALNGNRSYDISAQRKISRRDNGMQVDIRRSRKAHQA